MSCKKRLDKAYEHALCLPLQQCSRYVIISDSHRGTGTTNDNFLKNQHLYFAALEYYEKRGFFLIELGDGEELWENRSIRLIEESHSDVYWMFYLFLKEKRLIRVYGNHDMELKGKILTYPIASACFAPPLTTQMEECVILENKMGGRDVCMVHGHQGDFFNSVCWKLSRFLVRYLWKPLERFGVNDPTSAARNYKKQKKYETCMAEWAKERGVYLLAGHSHRPVLPEEGEYYINSGSCVHPRSITAIEIEGAQMSLVKWSVTTRPDMTLFVERTLLAGPNTFLRELHKSF